MNLHSLFENVSEEKCPHCNGPMFSELMINEKKDACYYKVKSRYKVWPSAYASGALVKCRKKGADSWGNKSEGVAEGAGKIGSAIKSLYKKIYNAGDDEIEYFYNDSPIFAQYWDEYEGDLDSIIAEVDPAELQVMLDELESYVNQAGLAEDQLDENLRQWFKEKWVRFGPDGKIRGDCARGDDSEGKPKCLPQAKAHALGKKGRASAAARKRREDPDPERRGPAHNVATKAESLSEGWRDIYNLNKQAIGKNPNIIKPGTVLKMPDKSQYEVKPGDNLSSIAKATGVKSNQPPTTFPKFTNPDSNAKPTTEPKYYTLPSDAVKTVPVNPPSAKNDSPYVFNPTTGTAGVKPDRIADVFQDPKLPPPMTRDEIEQQMMKPDFAGPNAPGFKHIVQGAEGEEYEFDSGQEAKDFQNRIEQLRLLDLERGGLGAAKTESISAKKNVGEAQTDYQKRRQRERDVDAGKLVKRQPKNPQNDYFARRKKERDMAEGRIVDPKNIDIFYTIPGFQEKTRVIAKNVPSSTLDLVIKGLLKKYKVDPKHIHWTPAAGEEQFGTRIAESRLYYNVIGTADKDLRSDFGMRKDKNGWYLKESSSPKYKMMAQRAFGSPKLQEYNFPAGQAVTGSDNVISPVGSVPRNQINKK